MKASEFFAGVYGLGALFAFGVILAMEEGSVDMYSSLLVGILWPIYLGVIVGSIARGL